MLVLFACIRVDLLQLLHELPAKLRQSTQVTAGPLSFQLRQEATTAGEPDLAGIIGALSASEVAVLLRAPASDSVTMSFYRTDSRDRFVTQVSLPTIDLTRTVASLASKGLLVAEEFGAGEPAPIAAENLERTMYSIRNELKVRAINVYQDDDEEVYVLQPDKTPKAIVRHFAWRASRKGQVAVALVARAIASLLAKDRK